MTARPITEGERALQLAGRIIDEAERDARAGVMADHAFWPESSVVVSRALLSTSSEVRRLREALEKIARQTLSVDMSVDDQLGGDFEGAYNYMIEDARAALSVEGEDGRATRSQGLATAPTDRL